MATSTKVKAKAAQEFVPIQEVRNGVVILKDGSLRAVLMASSINLALKSEDEQRAIILQFQSFLNSLEFSTQFFVQSRELDIRPYIALLESRYTEMLDDLMKIQIREYINFIKDFTERANIMSKNFFIVVPYATPTISAKKSFLSSLFPSRQSKVEKEDTFDEAKTQLEQRVSIVKNGLSRVGVRSTLLGTE